MNRLIIALAFLCTLAAAQQKTLRHARRNVLAIETKEKAAELLDTLWEENGIKKPHGRARKMKGDTESKSSKGMSFYYY